VYKKLESIIMENEISRRDFMIYSAVSGLALTSSFPGAASADTPHDEFLDFDMLGLAELIKTKQISQAELVDIIISRIETAEPALGFMTNRFYDRARAKAGTFSLDSPFAGVPFLIKDMIDVGGVRRTDGSRLLEKNVPENNVAYIDAVESAGLNIIGMTNVPELASFIITDNELFGPTHNPWGLEWSAFTSSGGSAAVVASGVMPMAHGTDGAGSCRLPSSVTGILGMKASRYRMLSGEADGAHDLIKTNQSMGRTVRDSAALLNYTEDKSGKNFEPLGIIEEPSKRRLKVGWVTDSVSMEGVHPEVQKVQESTAELLAAMGHQVEEVTFPVDFESMLEGFLMFFRSRVDPLANVYESGLLTPVLATHVEAALRYSPESIAAGLAFTDSLPQIFAKAFESYDVMLLPVSPALGVKLNEADWRVHWSDEVAWDMAYKLKFTMAVNFAGCPAMSVPLGWGAQSGLPIGSHFIAGYGEDRTLYELAYELEEARPWRHVWAPYSLKTPGKLT
jgi:amidase